MKGSVEFFKDDQNIELVPGQRGKYLLVVDGHTFSQNNVMDKTTYWNCRKRSKGLPPCHARVMTTLKENGLYRITITRPHHNHLPATRMLGKYQPNVFRDTKKKSQ